MLLRRVIEHVKVQNWTAVGLDFVIVVFGVFIGIQVSNWNDFQRERGDERLILMELRQSLTTDANRLSENIDRLNAAISDMSELRSHMVAGKPYDRTLDQKFGVVYGAIDLQLKTGPYEQLKAGRLSLIRNNDLRSQIVDVFDSAYSRAEQYTNYIQVNIILDKYWPYFMENFHGIVQWETATPQNYDALLADSYFFNILDYRIVHIRRGLLDAYLEAQIAATQLVEAINEELGE